MLRSTGIVRKVDELGRVVIPVELRRTLSIAEGDGLEIYTDDKGQVILKKHIPGCMRCCETENIIQLDNIKLCPKCAGEIAREAGIV